MGSNLLLQNRLFDKNHNPRFRDGSLRATLSVSAKVYVSVCRVIIIKGKYIQFKGNNSDMTIYLPS